MAAFETLLETLIRKAELGFLLEGKGFDISRYLDRLLEGVSRGGITIDKNEYDKIAKDPYTWYRAGQRMHFAARKVLKLWRDAVDAPEVIAVDFNSLKSRQAFYDHHTSRRELFSTYMMLMGYAIENMTKGLDLYIMRKEDAPEIRMPAYDIKSLRLKDHDEKLNRLKHVVKTLNIPFNEYEEDAAILAVDHVLWVGKYPIPKESGKDDYTKRMLKDNLVRQKCADVLDSLFLKLERKLSRY